jgi:hypothetical protein
MGLDHRWVHHHISLFLEDIENGLTRLAPLEIDTIGQFFLSCPVLGLFTGTQSASVKY